MPNDIGVKMGVTGLAQFKQSMNQAQQSVKTLDAELKLNEKQYKANGDAETYMAQKSKLLQQQIAAQNSVVKQGQQALDFMTKNGVSQASAAYQKMQRQVLEAQAALLDIQGDLSGVGAAAQVTTQKTDQLTSSLNGINKKVNFDAVLGGIGKITTGMEAAARRISSSLGDIWGDILSAAGWADDESTMASMYGISVERLQAMQKVAEKEIQTPVDSIIKSQQKLANALKYGGKDFEDALNALGVITTKGGKWWTDTEGQTGEQIRQRIQDALKTRDVADIFWDIGEAIMHYDDAIERDAMAQKIFGENWLKLQPLFQAGREKYEETLDAQTVVSEENIDRLSELSLKVKEMNGQWDTFKRTVEGEVAQSFSTLAGAVGDVLRQFNEYLATPEGQEKLSALGEAITEIFSGFTDDDVSGAVEVLGGALDKVKAGLGWLAEHKKDVEEAIKGIGAAFVGLKAAEILGTLAQNINALKQLIGGGGKGGASASPASAPNGGGSRLSMAKVLAREALPFVLEDAAVITAAVAPAVIAQNADYAEAEREREERLKIAGQNNGTDAAFLAAAAGALGLQRNGDGELIRGWLGSIRWGDPAAIEAILTGLQDRQNQQLAELYNTINQYSPTTSDGNYTWNQLQRYWAGEPMDLGAETALLESIAAAYAAELEAMEAPKVEIDPELPADAGAQLESQLSGLNLSVPVSVVPRVSVMSHANGLPFVPFDGYIAALHKGERVVPANVNKSQSYTSNVYFDNTHINNPVDAQGLADMIATAGRRGRAGFGS